MLDLTPAGYMPPWHRTAIGEIGVKEIPGREHNPRILEYLATCDNLGPWALSRDETPSCSAFVNWCFVQHGIAGTNHAAARSWLSWGVRLDEPQRGAVTVIQRRAPGRDAATGSQAGFHVTFFDGMTRGYLIGLGSNQRDQVKRSRYPLNRYHIHGFFWPKSTDPTLDFP